MFSATARCVSIADHWAHVGVIVTMGVCRVLTMVFSALMFGNMAHSMERGLQSAHMDGVLHDGLKSALHAHGFPSTPRTKTGSSVVMPSTPKALKREMSAGPFTVHT